MTLLFKIMETTEDLSKRIHFYRDCKDTLSTQQYQVWEMAFLGKKIDEMCVALNLSRADVCWQVVQCARRTGFPITEKGIESGSFYRKWGLKPRDPMSYYGKPPEEPDPMSDPAF